MVKKPRVHATDLHGLNRLTIDGIASVVDLVEAMHHNIAWIPGIISNAKAYARYRTDRKSGPVHDRGGRYMAFCSVVFCGHLTRLF